MPITRRAALATLGGLTASSLVSWPSRLLAQTSPEVDKSVQQALDWLVGRQSRLGHWPHDTYPVAIAALAGTALICSGSTTTQGPYAKNIRRTVDYLLSKFRKNGLIGDPKRDNRYTYGHGFSMLFLSQILGEEEDIDRREDLTRVLERAVNFSVQAQTKAGGWGYVSGKESNFDEGSTTITQVQGLRGCRNAGIVVPKKAIEDAKQYIYKCQNKDGGISYSSTSLGNSREAITAAALAALYNAGDYDSKYVPTMWEYCRKRMHNPNRVSFGHWHYTYLYYTQVVYRQGPNVWRPYRDRLYKKLMGEQDESGGWTQGNIGPEYVTACNLIMMQMDNGYLPIYQR